MKALRFAITIYVPVIWSFSAGPVTRQRPNGDSHSHEGRPFPIFEKFNNFNEFVETPTHELYLFRRVPMQMLCSVRRRLGISLISVINELIKMINC